MNPLTPPAPFSPSPQPGLIAYLELLLERARAGEVQFFVGSAGITPADDTQSLKIEAFSAIGDRVPRWPPPARSAAYATSLEGLADAAMQLEKAMSPLKSRIVE